MRICCAGQRGRRRRQIQAARRYPSAAIGMVLDRANIDLVSEMDDDFVRSIFLNPQPSAQKAFDEAMEKYGPDASVIAMPFGGATLPIAES